MAVGNNFEFKVIGADRLRKRLKANNLLMTPLRTYFNGTGKVVKKYAKENTPEDTGALTSSIKYKKVQSKGALPKGIMVFSDKSYAKEVHGAINAKHKFKGLKFDKDYSRENRAQFDRTSGRQVSAQKLKGWSERKGLNPHAVSKSIARQGTPIVPFLKMGYEQSLAERKVLLLEVTKKIERKYKRGR